MYVFYCLLALPKPFQQLQKENENIIHCSKSKTFKSVDTTLQYSQLTSFRVSFSHFESSDQCYKTSSMQFQNCMLALQDTVLY